MGSTQSVSACNTWYAIATNKPTSYDTHRNTVSHAKLPLFGNTFTRWRPMLVQLRKRPPVTGGDQEESKRTDREMSQRFIVRFIIGCCEASAERRGKKVCVCKRERERRKTHSAFNFSFKNRCHSSHRNVLRSQAVSKSRHTCVSPSRSTPKSRLAKSPGSSVRSGWHSACSRR